MVICSFEVELSAAVIDYCWTKWSDGISKENYRKEWGANRK